MSYRVISKGGEGGGGGGDRYAKLELASLLLVSKDICHAADALSCLVSLWWG